MKNLMDTYKMKMKSAKTLLAQLNSTEDNEARIRITSQVNCYNFFIFELERLMLTKNREKQREGAQSLLMREVTQFNQMGYQKETNSKQLSNNDDKKLRLFSN